jgi:Tfp pilus assembly protein PilF
LAPKDDRAYCGRGIFYISKFEYGKALADLTQAIRLNPKCARAYFSRGWIYHKIGENGRAEADFTHAKELGYEGERVSMKDLFPE